MDKDIDKDIDKLLSYSLERLNEKEKLEFEEALNESTKLDEELSGMNRLLETVALAEEPIEPSMKLKQSLFDSLDANTPFAGYVSRFMRLFDLEKSVVEALFEKITRTPQELFESCGIPKTSLFYFDGGEKVAGNTCGILKIKRGGIFPAHQHQGKEWVLVLQGSAVDQSGMEYLPGDTIYSDESVSHALRIGKDQDLIFAVVLEKPNKWLVGQIIGDYILPNRRFKPS